MGRDWNFFEIFEYDMVCENLGSKKIFGLAVFGTPAQPDQAMGTPREAT